MCGIHIPLIKSKPRGKSRDGPLRLFLWKRTVPTPQECYVGTNARHSRLLPFFSSEDYSRRGPYMTQPLGRQYAGSQCPVSYTGARGNGAYPIPHSPYGVLT